MAKMTRVEALNFAIELCKGTEGTEEMVEVLSSMAEKLKEKSTSHKPSKTVEANEKFRVEILEALKTFGQAMSIAEIKEACTSAEVKESVGVNKVSALLSPMVKAGVVRKEVVKRNGKRVTVFSYEAEV